MITALVGSAMLLTGTSAPIPDGAGPRTLDEELLINAIPTHVREWVLDLTLDESARFYRRYLGERHVELGRDHGLLLAAPTGEGFTTVELLQASGSRTRVRVSEARLGAGGARPIQELIPLPPHTRVLSSVSGGKHDGAMQTLVARTSTELAALASFYEQVLSQRGLRMTHRRPLQQGPNEAEGLSFVGAGQRIEIVLTAEAGQTWIAVMLSGGTQ